MIRKSVEESPSPAAHILAVGFAVMALACGSPPICAYVRGVIETSKSRIPQIVGSHTVADNQRTSALTATEELIHLIGDGSRSV